VPGLSGAVAATGDERAGAVFSALADPTRRAMLRSLRAEPSTASRMADDLPITRQAVAKHLAALRTAGLVEAHREGRETRYVVTPAPLSDAMAWMAGTGGVWDARLARLAERAASR
jgi:DNA-binding transcriptional ArsR family regulator